MPSDSNIWKKLRGKVEAIFCETDEDCSKGRRKMVRRVFSNQDSDLDERITRLRKAMKSGHITKKQYRLAKKLIVASYE